MPNANIIKGTPETFSKFSMCGYKDLKNPGYSSKVDWNIKMYEKGMRYDFLIDEKSNAIGGIEYMPAEYSPRPCNAPGYLMINCLYIMKKPYKGLGYGSQLLESCLSYAQENSFSGVAVIVRDGSWMAGDKLFLKHGFNLVEENAEAYKLLALKLKDEADTPQLIREAIPEIFANGLYLFYSHQCPYTYKAIADISEIAEKEFEIAVNVVNIDENNYFHFAPFGTFHIVYNGELIAYHPISGTRFRNIMKKLHK
jgi:GNAT superfamily N-acetyltransferase